jgi:ketosteroid isomerase-like protein
MPPSRSAADWLACYAAAWRGRDAAGVGTLFHEDVAYAFDPFAPPLGLDAVVVHWTAAFATQAEVDLAVRVVADEGEHAAAEWWASILTTAGEELTLSASLLLRFAADGRCSELHEHWLRHDGRLPAPERFQP